MSPKHVQAYMNAECGGPMTLLGAEMMPDGNMVLFFKKADGSCCSMSYSYQDKLVVLTDMEADMIYAVLKKQL